MECIMHQQSWKDNKMCQKKKILICSVKSAMLNCSSPLLGPTRHGHIERTLLAPTQVLVFCPLDLASGEGICSSREAYVTGDDSVITLCDGRHGRASDISAQERVG